MNYMNNKFLFGINFQYIFIGSYRKNKLKKDRKDIKNKCDNVLLNRDYNTYYVHTYINKVLPKFLIKNGKKNTIFFSTENFINFINWKNIKELSCLDFTMVIFKKRVMLFKFFNKILLKNNVKIVKFLYKILYKILLQILNVNKILMIPLIWIKKNK